MTDKLAPFHSPHFGDSPVVQAARDLGATVYLAGRCDIIHPRQIQNLRGDRKEILEVLRTDVPYHVARLQTQRGLFGKGGQWDGDNVTDASSSSWLVALPWGTQITDQDRIVDRATRALYSVLEVDDHATYGVFVWCRVSHVGVHPNG